MQSLTGWPEAAFFDTSEQFACYFDDVIRIVVCDRNEPAVLGIMRRSPWNICPPGVQERKIAVGVHEPDICQGVSDSQALKLGFFHTCSMDSG